MERRIIKFPMSDSSNGRHPSIGVYSIIPSSAYEMVSVAISMWLKQWRNKQLHMNSGDVCAYLIVVILVIALFVHWQVESCNILIELQNASKPKSTSENTWSWMCLFGIKEVRQSPSGLGFEGIFIIRIFLCALEAISCFSLCIIGVTSTFKLMWRKWKSI